MALMSEAGLKPNKLTNVWVPFVVAAARSLKRGGRLALVIPAELLQVTYAAQLRRFLTKRFDAVGIVSCNELIFENAEQEVILLLASGYRDISEPEEECRVSFVERDLVSAVVSEDPNQILLTAERKEVCGDSEKWLKYFLSSKEIEFMRELRASDMAVPLSMYADVDVGIVTGKNQFFVLRDSDSKAAKYVLVG